MGGSSNNPQYLDASGSGKILIGDGSDLSSKTISGDATLTSQGVLTIVNDAITTSKLENSSVTTAKIGANAVVLGSKTTGNYVSTVTGTSNEVSVSGQIGDITIGLDNNIDVNSVSLKTGSNKVSIHPPDTLSSDYTIKLPENDGEENTALVTNGSGVTHWGPLPGTILNIINYSPSTNSQSHTLSSQMSNLFTGSLKTTFTAKSNKVLITISIFNKVSSFSDRTTLLLGLSGNSSSTTYSEWSDDYSNTNNQETKRLITLNCNTSGIRTCEWILSVVNGTTYNINIAGASSGVSHTLEAGFKSSESFPACVFKVINL